MVNEAHTHSEETGSGLDFGVLDIWSMLLRNARFIAGVTAATVLGTVVVLQFLRPVYEGEATVLLTEARAAPSLIKELATLSSLGGLGGGQGPLATDISILQSRHIAEDVTESLALHVELMKPERRRNEVFRRLEASRDALPGTYTFRLQPDGSYRPDAATAARGVPPLTVGAPVAFAGLTLELSPELRSAPPERIQMTVHHFVQQVETVRRQIEVERPNRESRVLSIRYRHGDAGIAAAVPNGVTASFVEYKTLTNQADSRSYGEFLREQLARYEAELADAESRLRVFRENAQVISPDHQAAEEIRRFVNLRAQQEELRTQRESLAQLMAQVGAGDVGRDPATSRYRALAAYPAFLASPSIQGILQSLIQMENERASLLVRRTESSIDVRGLNERIAQLETELLQNAQHFHRSVSNELGIVDAAVARFTAQLGEVPATEMEYVRLSRQQKLLEQIYLLVQTRLKETEMQEASESDAVRVLDQALVPMRPVFPRPLLSLGLAFVVGLMVGTAGAFGRERLSPRVRTRSDLESRNTRVPVLGVIPRFDAAPSENRRIRIVPFRPRKVVASDPLVVRSTPLSSPSEAYRALRTNLGRLGGSRASQVLVISSTAPGEGKTASVANLALAFAQHDKRTLLIDGDLRKPTLDKLLDARRAPGLVDVLLEKSGFAEAVQQVDAGKFGLPLDFLAAGATAVAPTELLGSSRMQTLVAELRERYDVILFDAPPLGLVIDAGVLGGVADATVLIARSGVTEPDALRNSVNTLHQLGIPIGGVILNAVDPSEKNYASSESYLRFERNGRHTGSPSFSE